MSRKLTLVLTISAALAALATEASAAGYWRGAGWGGRHFGYYAGGGLPGAGLRYGWGVHGLGYYGFGVPYHGDYGYDYYGSAYPSDFVPRNPSECGDGCPTYHFSVAVTGHRW
jgi:hypothetical protein